MALWDRQQPAQKIQTTEDRTNILILGRSGEGHDSPDLTDTIIFASVGHTDHSVKLISLPRDIWIPELRAKLNSTYYWGNQRQKGGGIILAKSTVESILGQPVHYGLV
ncbi:MAG: LCP family protein, partial [Patescibacteria group bacterium]